MALEQTETIDLVSMNAEGTEVILHLLATEAWDPENQRLVQLQSKLKNYVAFAADGQLLRQYPEAAGKNVCIVLRASHPLSATAQKLVDAAREHWCQPERISIIVRVEAAHCSD